MKWVIYDLLDASYCQPAAGRQRQVFSVIGGDNVQETPVIPARVTLHVVTPFFI